MTLSQPATRHLGLHTGPHWTSFEELRVKHAEKLDEIQPGTFGRLKVKRRKFVIVDESDFERFEEVIDEIEKMVDQIKVLRTAAAAAEKHQDQTTLTVLKATADMADRTIQRFIETSLRAFTLDSSGDTALDPELQIK